MSYYNSKELVMETALTIAIPLAVIQFLLSTIAAVYKWDSKLTSSIEASNDYFTQSCEFKDLADYPPDEFSDFKNRITKDQIHIKKQA